MAVERHSAQQPSPETQRPEFTVGRGEVKVPVIDARDPNPVVFFDTLRRLNTPGPEAPAAQKGQTADKTFMYQLEVPAGSGKPKVVVKGEYVVDREPIYDPYEFARKEGVETHTVLTAADDEGTLTEVVSLRREDWTEPVQTANVKLHTLLEDEGKSISPYTFDYDDERLREAQLQTLQRVSDLIS